VAKATAEPGERLEDAAERSQPPDLVRPARPAKDDDTASACSTIIRNLRKANPRLRKFWIGYLDDAGEEGRMPISVSFVSNPALRAKILKVLRDSAVPLNRKQIALAIRAKSHRGRFGQEVSAMEADEEIFDDGSGMYTDDESKFG